MLNEVFSDHFAVRTNYLTAIDAKVKLLFAASAIMIAVSSQNPYVPLGIFFLFLAIPVMWLVDGRKLKETTLHAIVASLVAWLVSEGSKYIFHTVRPFVVSGIEPLTLTWPRDPAFPSTHTAITFALSVTIFFHHKKIGFAMLLMSLAIGIARVAAGVHYPIDILGGAVIGSLVSIVIHKFHFFPRAHSKT